MSWKLVQASGWSPKCRLVPERLVSGRACRIDMERSSRCRAPFRESKHTDRSAKRTLQSRHTCATPLSTRVRRISNSGPISKRPTACVPTSGGEHTPHGSYSWHGGGARRPTMSSEVIGRVNGDSAHLDDGPCQGLIRGIICQRRKLRISSHCESVAVTRGGRTYGGKPGSRAARAAFANAISVNGEV